MQPFFLFFWSHNHFLNCVMLFNNVQSIMALKQGSLSRLPYKKYSPGGNHGSSKMKV